MHKIFIFLIFLSSVSYSAISHKNLKPNKQLIQSNKIHYSLFDLKYAKNIIELSNSLSGYKINLYNLNKLIALNKKTNTFQDLKTPISQLKKLSSSKNNLSFIKHCLYSMPTEASPVANDISNKVQKYCQHRFLTYLTKNPDIAFLDNPQYFSYFENSIPFWVKDRNSKFLVKYLNKISTKIMLYKKISELITNQLIYKNIFPNEKLINNLYISDQFSSFLTSIALKDPATRDYFSSEFKVLYKKFKKAYLAQEKKTAFSYLDQMLGFYSQNTQFISKNLAWKMFTWAGKRLIHEDKQRALNIFNYIKQIGSRKQKMDTTFDILWTHVIHKDYKVALSFIEKNNLIAKYANLPEKLQYWICEILIQTNEPLLARHLFEQLIKSHPLSYYSVLSTQKLKDLEKKQHKNNITTFLPDSKPVSSLYKNNKIYTSKFKNYVKRISVWSDLGKDKYAYKEIKKLTSFSKETIFKNKKVLKEISEQDSQKIIALKLTDLLSQKKHFLQTFKLIYKSLRQDVLNFNVGIAKLLFPLKYITHIKSLEKNIDPIIILSLIRQESAFNPNAKSHVGARGLMQLMPNTAKQIKKKVRTSQLTKNPYLNLKIGIKYFKQLLKKYDGNLVFALSAYNAGEHRIKTWKQEYFHYDDPLLNIEVIPFKETQQYVKLIFRNMFFYNLIQGDGLKNKNLNNSFFISKN